MYAIYRRKAALKAWYWVVHFRRRGKPHAKRFYDLSYGGSKRSLAAALAWRDEQLQKAKILTMREFHEQKRSNNRSGVPGVHFHRTRDRPRGFWQAAIRFRSGKRMARSFSVRSLGNEEAFDRAVAARAELLAMVEDRPYLRHPVAKLVAAKRVGTERYRRNGS